MNNTAFAAETALFHFRTRIGTLEAEKFDLEDKVKSLKKELDLVKKKAAEDRSKAKKDKVGIYHQWNI